MILRVAHHGSWDASQVKVLLMRLFVRASVGTTNLLQPRSGTSMLTGLLSNFGYVLGAKGDSDLFPPSFDNEKGFFEHKYIVFQNDKFFEGG